MKHILLLFLFPLMLLGQDQAEIDSLLKSAKHDTTKAYYLIGLLSNAKHDITRAKLLKNIGVLYYYLGDYKETCNYWTKSLKLYKELGDESDIVASLNNICDNQGNNEHALDYHSQCLKLFEKIGNKRGIVYALNDIGYLYYEQNKTEKAISCGEKGLALAQEVGLVEKTKSNSELLFKAYQKSGNHKRSLEMYQIFIEMRDSMINKEKQKKIHFEKYILEKDKALVKKNEEILKKNLQNKSLYFIGGIVILILLLLFLFGGDNPKK